MLNPQNYVNTNTLDVFIKEAKRRGATKMTRERELVVIKLAQLGDKEATDELILSHVPLVIHIAKGILSNNAENDELLDAVQAGIQGLPNAITKYRPDKTNGGRFGTYAKFWIRKYIYEMQRMQVSQFSISDHDYRIRRRIEEVVDEIEKNDNRTPTVIEIARLAGLKMSDVRRRLVDMQVSSDLVDRIEKDFEQNPIAKTEQVVDELQNKELERQTIKQLYEELKKSTTEAEKALCVFLLQYMEYRPREVCDIMNITSAQKGQYVDSIQQAYLNSQS